MNAPLRHGPVIARPFEHGAYQVLHVALGPCDGRLHDARRVEPGIRQRRAHLVHRTPPHGLVAHHAALRLVRSRLELRLHQPYEHRARLRETREHGRERREADEAEVGHQHVEGSAQFHWIGQLDVHALEHAHARILPQLPCQLPVVHVDARHAGRARLQQAVAETAGGRADVQAPQTAHVLSERIERPLQLMAAARHEPLAVLHHHLGIRRHAHGGAGGVHVAHLHLVRQHRAQRRVGIREVSLLHQQRIKSDFFMGTVYSKRVCTDGNGGSRRFPLGAGKDRERYPTIS